MPSKESFAQQLDGKNVDLFALTNGAGMQVWLTNYGARIVSLVVNGKDGRPYDVVVGFDTLQGYLSATEVYHGATIGRYANRIANGRFSIDGKEYTLEANNGINHLHGGPAGFHTRVWEVVEQGNNSIRFTYRSPDGEEGYPGNLEVSVHFTLSEQNEVVIRYEATTDAATVLNITNHAYFNLNGVGSGTILNHTLEIDADAFTPVDENLIPTGELQPVSDSPFDFTKPKTIGKQIREKHQQLQYGNGYDHNYVLKNKGQLQVIARAQGDKSGIGMEVSTDQPGVQFYTGNFMSGENLIQGDVPDHFRTAFCLETQHFPDSPNHPHFPSAVLQPGNLFRSSTVYKFI